MEALSVQKNDSAWVASLDIISLVTEGEDDSVSPVQPFSKGELKEAQRKVMLKRVGHQKMKGKVS